jgi:glycosyltransferase involved in cell wall biosynthesis
MDIPGCAVPSLKVCFNTQTPLVQFLPGGSNSPSWASVSEPVDLSKLSEGTDYRLSPGGVTRMVLPIVERLMQDGVISDAHWVALNPSAPPEVRLRGITLHNVGLPPDRMASYARAKEAIWARVHGVDGSDHHDDLFWTEAFAEYSYYNRITTELIQRLDGAVDFDTFYIHDFQQLPVGEMLGTLKPKIFRWHIPFDDRAIPAPWRSHLGAYLNSYDVIVVSARRYATALAAFYPAKKIVRQLPYVDPAEYSRPSGDGWASALDRFGIRPDDRVALVVARMDPTKGQDRAVDAVRGLLPDFPSLKLVLVGNGSFSSARGGLGLSKSDRWRAQLEERVKAGGLGGHVVFTGHVSQHELDCLYERCEFTILPSVREGFGLVVVESWLHGKPAIVTRRAGVAELIRTGRNGLLYNPDAAQGLETAMRRLLGDRTGRLAKTLADGGRRAAQKCSVEAAATSEQKILERAVGS